MRWQSKDRKAIDVAGGGRPSSMSRGLHRRSVEMSENRRPQWSSDSETMSLFQSSGSRDKLVHGHPSY
jgi:hypothetical protein